MSVSKHTNFLSVANSITILDTLRHCIPSFAIMAVTNINGKRFKLKLNLKLNGLADLFRKCLIIDADINLIIKLL